jgi:hypothetical protein
VNRPSDFPGNGTIWRFDRLLLKNWQPSSEVPWKTAKARRPLSPFQLMTQASCLLKRLQVTFAGSEMRRVRSDTPVHHEQTVRERMVRPGRRMRRVCTGTPVHHEQTKRKVGCGTEDAARVYGYTGTSNANSLGKWGAALPSGVEGLLQAAQVRRLAVPLQVTQGRGGCPHPTSLVTSPPPAQSL